MEQSSKNSKIIKASPAKLYAALTEAHALETWQAPGDMRGKVHQMDLRVGGGYEMSLYYPEGEEQMQGKTNEKEDRFRVRYKELVPNEKIVEVTDFQSTDPAFAGEMTITITLEPKDGGTEVTFLFTNIPRGIDPKDNEAGTLSSLEKLAKYVE